MVKAMYSGVAGLKAHQSKMDVIGNNIANVNTWGYKAMDTSFKESIYSLVNGASGGSTADGGYGGTNPSMVGYGSMVSAISSNFTSGNQVPTGKNLDLYIDGTAFFAVGPMYGEGEAKSPSDIFLSRVGDFSVVNNYLVDSNGRYIYGSPMNTGGVVYNPTATSKETYADVDMDAHLPANASKVSNTGAKLTMYGTQTDAGLMTEYTYKASYPYSWGAADTSIFTGLPANPTAEDVKKAVDQYNKAHIGANELYVINPDKPTQVTKVTLEETNKDQTIPVPDTTVVKDSVTGVTTTKKYEVSKTEGKFKETTTITTPPDEDAERKGPQFNDGRMVFDSETGAYKMSENVGTLSPLKIPTSCTYYDEAGTLQTENNINFSTFTVQQDGMIYGTSAASKRVYLVGCVGLVNVSNPGGMSKSDGPYYQLSQSSGDGTIVQPGGVVGKLSSGYLESANVDIATEFSSMITTERGFQANSKIITVTDEMLQELVNMKR